MLASGFETAFRRFVGSFGWMMILAVFLAMIGFLTIIGLAVCGALKHPAIAQADEGWQKVVLPDGCSVKSAVATYGYGGWRLTVTCTDDVYMRNL